MSKIYILYALSLLPVFGCNQRDKISPATIEKFTILQNTLVSRFSIENGDIKNSIVFILHYDSICSCNGKNTPLVRQIRNKGTNYKQIVILKNDLKKVLENAINISGPIYIRDTSRLLEKNGNVFRYDKLFIINNGELEQMFDLEDKDVQSIKKRFNL